MAKRILKEISFRERLFKGSARWPEKGRKEQLGSLALSCLVSAVKLEASGRCEALWGKQNSALSMFSLSCWQNNQVEIASTQPGI